MLNVAERSQPGEHKGLHHLLPALHRQRWAFVGGFGLLVAANATAATIPYLMKLATDALQGHDTTTPADYALILALVAVINALFRVASRTFIYRIGREIEYHLRRIYHQKLQELDSSFFGRSRTGDLVSRGTNDLLAVRMLVGPGFLQVVNTLMIYAMTLPIMFALEPRLSFLILLPLPLVILLAQRLTRRLYQLSREVADKFGDLTGFVQESMAGMAVIRNHVRSGWWLDRFDREAGVLLAAQQRHTRLQSLFGPLMVLSGGLGGLILLGVGGQLVAAREMSIGTFVAFAGYLSQLIWPTVGFGWILTVLQRGMAAMARISAILDAPSQPEAPAHPEGVGAIGKGAIEIRNLRFAFPDSASAAPVEVLKGLSLAIPAGSWVGVIGRIGAGKTVLLHCLARLLPVAPGSLLIDGVDLNEIPEASLRQLIAVAPQEGFLFSATVRDNLLYANPDLPDPVAWAAARQAALDEEIAEFPDQLASRVVERGITLSGGQRQRLALARALTTDAPILLLDDIFASVDARTEERILRHLRSQTRGRTLVMVCHRVAGLHQADWIVVLDQGRVSAQGTHATLSAQSPLYRNLHDRMARDEALETLQ